MKKRVNLITALLVIAFGLNIVTFFMEEFGHQKESFKKGWEEGSGESKKKQNLTENYYLTLIPENYSVKADSVYNEKTGNWLPSRTIQTAVSVPVKKMYTLKYLWIVFAAFSMLAAFGVIVVEFIKLIISVNKSVIFEWINVRRLRLIGIGFSILFIINIIVGLYYYHQVLETIQIPGYTIIKSDTFQVSTFILGLISFLIAEIFSVGLRMKKDQDLTI